MINTLKIYNDLKQTMDPSAAEKIVEVIGSVYEELKNSVTKTEFNELKEVVRELAVNVSRLEHKVEDLVGEMKVFKRELGGLSHTVGYRLEDEAMKSLPALLSRDLSIETQGSLIRDYIEIGPRNYVELNIWGHGIKDGKTVEIIGEAKSQLKKRDVDQFLQTLKIIEPVIKRPIVPLFVTYQTSPDVRRYIQDKNIALYFSYQL
jgi:predicted nuclease with TOPRIM domain